MYKILTPNQSVLKAYLKESVSVNELQAFRKAIQTLLTRINPSESEGFNKNLVMDFLSGSLYRSNSYMVNSLHNTDLAIYSDVSSPNEHPVVLFEFKGPSRPDMVTKSDLKKKAMYELVLYYIREEVQKRNTDIKHLIITNCWEYFVFEKKLFYQLFAKDKRFVEKVLSADTGGDSTDYIYNAIIKPKVEEIESKFQFTYLDLKRFEKFIQDEDVISDRYFISAYKLLSPVHLLRQPFKSDHNTLNRNFYKELLYIMGVKEIVDDHVHKIVRLKDGRQAYSFFEQTYAKLDDYSDMADENKRFETALGLVLIWVNRILFLKLLESQLKSFNVDTDVKFLDTVHLNDYDSLNDLFFKVLAKPLNERSEELDMQFPNVPYLNSSLFEMSKIEETYFAVSGIRLGEMEIYKQTVLKNGKGKRRTGKIKTLDYFLAFLDAYDFGTEHSSGNPLIHESGKTLINASVLGLIFEKINGYKDGSFFTPGYITQYICHKTLRRAVIDKFNKLKGWNCVDFEELKDKIEYGQREVRIEANRIINSIKICDPAVGSGHFLVSALNELIAIKSELGVLQDRQEQPKRIKDYDVRVEQDELVISDEDGDYFKYDPSDTASQRIQEALFEEKQEIIENCLFGVDLNPKSVEICRLRLWIELLKNAYYYRNEDGKRVLQTLPNIDINIKCGNSLASNHPVCIGRKIQSVEGMRNLVLEYKQNVKEYKICHSKKTKQTLNNKIAQLKRRLMPAYQLDAFADNTQSIREHSTMRHALEWMVEFPEVLKEDGTFEGFDVIIGNPPYVSLEKLSVDSSVYEKMYRIGEKSNEREKVYHTHESRGDIYSLFIERGLQLLRKNGLLSYIIPNKWEKVMYGRSLRELFLAKNLYQLVDFGDNQIFDDATTYTCIIRMRKEQNRGSLCYSFLKTVNPEILADSIEECKEMFDTKLMDNGIWTISSKYSFNMIKKCKERMATLGKYVGGESYYGIKTSLSDVFKISIEKADELIKKDASSGKILRPFLQGRGLKSYIQAVPEAYVIFTPKGFTAQGMGVDREKKSLPTEEKAWEWFKNSYPAVADWLEPFKDKAKKRTDKGDYWWELRACAYYDKFVEPKIFYQVFQTKPCFVYDNSSTFCNNSMYFLSVSDKSLLALLCSRIGWWLISEYCPRIQNGHQLIWDNFKQIPIPQQLPDVLGGYAEEMMSIVGNEDESRIIAQKIDQEVCKLYDVDLNMI